jgi:hypothetical protein
MKDPEPNHQVTDFWDWPRIHRKYPNEGEPTSNKSVCDCEYIVHQLSSIGIMNFLTIITIALLENVGVQLKTSSAFGLA